MRIHSYSGHPSRPQEVNGVDGGIERGMSLRDRFHLTEDSILSTVKLKYIIFTSESYLRCQGGEDNRWEPDLPHISPGLILQSSERIPCLSLCRYPQSSPESSVVTTGGA